MTTRHEFLTMLHRELRPEFYLEIGVHTGESLRLAHEGTRAWGIDPNPLVGTPGHHIRHLGGRKYVFAVTSDQFFEDIGDVYEQFPEPIDLAFIDGMHLWEYALRDFMNIEKHSHDKTVVVFDDVLPYSQEIATRTQPPGGDWTGDVWKVMIALAQTRLLPMTLVDTFPTGSLLVWGLNRNHDWEETWRQVDVLAINCMNDEVPPWIIERREVVSAKDAVHELLEDLA